MTHLRLANRTLEIAQDISIISIKKLSLSLQLSLVELLPKLDCEDIFMNACHFIILDGINFSKKFLKILGIHGCWRELNLKREVE